MYLFLLSGENADLGKEEILALSNTREYEIDERILIINKKFDFKRVAFCNKIYALIDKVNSLNDINKINFMKYYKRSFRVRISKIPSNLDINCNEKDIADLIWKKIKHPMVDLENPKTKFDFLFTKNSIYACLEIFENKKNKIRLRDAKFRPEFHPSSLNALFAKALVNLSCVKRDETLMDPFCGVGGILIEAGLTGCKLVGYDINPEMIEKCKTNLKYYKIKNFKLVVDDALKIRGKVDAIVTDLPYGRHSSLYGRDINCLYNDFIKKSYDLLKKRKMLILMMPDSLDVPYYHHKFILKSKILHRIHKGLTRKILVLEKN